jgi:hypothetical protein
MPSPTGIGWSSLRIVRRAPAAGDSARAAPAGGARRPPPAAGERGEAEQRAVALGPQRRQGGALLLGKGGDAGDVETGAPARLRDPDLKRPGAFDQGEAALGDLKPLRRRRGIGIGPGRLSRDDHADRVPRRLLGREVSAAGLDRAGHPAEQIGFVGYAKTPIEAPAVPVRAGGHLGFGRPRIGRAGADPHFGQAAGPGFAQDRADARDIGHGNTQVRIVLEGILDQLIEHRILVEPPPAVLQRRLSESRIVRADKCARGGAWRLRPHIVRADGAARQSEGAGGGEEEWLHHHCPHSAGTGSGSGALPGRA